MTNFLVSYPRSGNTWMRYCVELLSNQPTTSKPTHLATQPNIIKEDAVGANALIPNLKINI